MSAVTITDFPEILYVGRHLQANKFGKQNIAVELKEHKETNVGGKKPKQKNPKTPKNKKIQQPLFLHWSLLNLKLMYVIQKCNLGKLLQPAFLRSTIQWGHRLQVIHVQANSQVLCASLLYVHEYIDTTRSTRKQSNEVRKKTQCMIYTWIGLNLYCSGFLLLGTTVPCVDETLSCLEPVTTKSR